MKRRLIAPKGPLNLILKKADSKGIGEVTQLIGSEAVEVDLKAAEDPLKAIYVKEGKLVDVGAVEAIEKANAELLADLEADGAPMVAERAEVGPPKVPKKKKGR